MIFLTAENVMSFNKDIVPNGAPELGRVEAVLSRVLNANMYDNVNDLHQLAAIYLICIARGHVFIDGNKRTAIQSSIYFLMLNRVLVSEDECLVELTVDAAQGIVDIDSVADVLRRLSY